MSTKPGAGMRAMVLQTAGVLLEPLWVPRPLAGPGQIQVRVEASGVCRTDLHLIDGNSQTHRCLLFQGMTLPNPPLASFYSCDPVGGQRAHNIAASSHKFETLLSKVGGVTTVPG